MPPAHADAAAASPPRARARYQRIIRFAALNLAQTWWFDLFLPRIGLRRLADRGRPERMRRFARRFHALAVELGGLMIKVGQYMSSRLDVLPPEITEELAGLQDEVPPVAFSPIQALAEHELGMTLDRAYASVEQQPMAAASLGQVHRARLAGGAAAEAGFADVVVKVQRPGIDEIVAVDLAALRRIATWVGRIRLVRDRMDARGLVEEFARTSLEEIDYLHEAQNAERFRAQFAGDARVAVPEIAWERTTRRVLTLADVTAIKIGDRDGLRAAGIDPAEVAAAFAAVMFEQVFTFGFFHADPHPGNVFITPTDAADPPGWRFMFVDFGMMGEIAPTVRAGLRRVVIAAATRDGKALVAGIDDVGALLPTADVRELERAMTELFARFGGMGFAELRGVDPKEFVAFAEEFGELARALPFQLPDDFLLFVRAISLTSGVCSTLDPDFNVWDAVEPFAARLLREESRGLLGDVGRQAMGVAATTMRLPSRIDDLVTHLERGDLSFDSARLEKRMSKLERLLRRVLGGVVFAGLLVGGALLHQADAGAGTVVMVASVLPLGYAVLPGRR